MKLTRAGFVKVLSGIFLMGGLVSAGTANAQYEDGYDRSAELITGLAIGAVAGYALLEAGDHLQDVHYKHKRHRHRHHHRRHYHRHHRGCAHWRDRRYHVYRHHQRGHGHHWDRHRGHGRDWGRHHRHQERGHHHRKRDKEHHKGMYRIREESRGHGGDSHRRVTTVRHF